MSDIIPPLLSNTPPPPPSPEEEDDDEFGDFTGANYLSYGCDNLSLPPSPPLHSPKKVSISNGLDINSNDEKNKVAQNDLGHEKDFQDKRKLGGSCTEEPSSEAHEDIIVHPVIDNLLIEDKSPKYNSNNYSENYSSSGALTVGEGVQKESNQECKLEEKSECSTIKKDSGNDTRIQETVAANIVQKDENTEYALKGNLNECNSLAVGEKSVGVEIYVNREIGLSSEINGSIENDHLEDFSQSDEHEDIENEEYECDSIHSVPEEVCSEYNAVESKFNSQHSSQNQVEYDSCMEENVPSFPEDSKEDEIKTSDSKISQRKESVCSTSQEKQVENIQNLALNIPLNNQEKEENTNDEFGDFAFADKTIDSPVKEDQDSEEFGEFSFSDSTKVHDSEHKAENELNDDFGEFTFPETSTYCNLDKESTPKTRESDDTDDFGEFASTTIEVNQEQDDFEFGNFANFADAAQDPVILTLNEKQAFEKAESILAEIFPVSSDSREDYQCTNAEKDDFIFNELKDITETQALTYQWSKSASQNMLLKALNIDARNILYGPSWNPSIPRFAANLGLQPLEPIKTEILTPSVLKSSPSVSTQPPTIEIPTAQFDWNGSGLINPLDYSQTMLLDLEQLVASLDIPTYNASSNSNNSSPTNELDDWDMWLKSVSKDSTETSPQADVIQKPPELPADQVFTLKPTPVSSEAEESTRVPTKSDLEQKIDPAIQQFDDFVSYTAGSQSHTSWPSIVPLRETYISNDNMTPNLNNKELPLDIESWLQPTIVTPELPRKDLGIGEEELPNIQTPELTRKSVPAEEIEDDFDDFQMVLPETKSTGSEAAAPSDILQPIKSEPMLPQQPVKSFDFADLSLFEVPSLSKPAADAPKQTKQDTFDDEDEFTEFHSSAPEPQPIVPKPLTPILEPLKPVPMYSAVTSAPATQINWPDPGITEEEIKKFEMVFTRPKESRIEELKREEPRKVKDEPKNLPSPSSIDDDEWSDFVSVQKPSPVHKFHLNEKERTSSPDLPLSVLNLGNIQPAKQPIPVITPHGLVQTKLSSNSSVNMSPKSQLKNNALTMQTKQVYQQPQIQPSIISNQYASQAYNFNSGYYNQSTKTGLNFPQSPQQKSLDEDDWSDFVSNPIPQNSANGYQQGWQNASSHPQPGWTSTSPNIITNPGHFAQSGSDLKNTKVNSKKSTIPSISLPELEFVAPKGRTSSSRKK